jgi:hypothetical protein
MQHVKTKRRKQKISESFIFEIVRWSPSYFFSVDSNKHRDGPYNEHAGIEIEATCIFPETLKGRSAQFEIAGSRDCLTPWSYKNDPDWVPRCVGELVLHPTRGRFYTSVPHDSLPFVLTAFAHDLFRYVLVYGPPLNRSKSLCSSFHLMQSVDLEEY